MFYSFKLYILDRWILLTAIASTTLFGVLCWYTVTHVHPSESSVFLHYNIIFGTDLVGRWQSQFTPLYVGAAVFFANGLASWFLYGSNRLVGRFLFVFTMAIEASLLVGQVLMLNLNL